MGAAHRLHLGVFCDHRTIAVQTAQGKATRSIPIRRSLRSVVETRGPTVVNLDEKATRRNGRKAAMIDAQGLIALHGISHTELKAVAAQIALERVAVENKIAEVVALMDRAGLTVADLEESPALSKSYRHPITGETWDGAGYQPDWLKGALLAEGYRPHELRVA